MTNELLKEQILDLVNKFWPVTTETVLEKLEYPDVTKDDIMLHFKELEREKKIVIRKNDETTFAWPIGVDSFLKSYLKI